MNVKNLWKFEEERQLVRTSLTMNTRRTPEGMIIDEGKVCQYRNTNFLPKFFGAKVTTGSFTYNQRLRGD
jgi:hypothetical protein